MSTGSRIEPFRVTTGRSDPQALSRKLNSNFAASTGLIVGDGIIEASRVGRNVHLRLKVENLLPRIPKTGSSLPTGQYQEMVYKMRTQNAAGFDFVRAHGILEV